MSSYVSTKDALTATVKTLMTEEDKRLLEEISRNAPVRITEAFIQRVAVKWMINGIGSQGYGFLFKHLSDEPV